MDTCNRLAPGRITCVVWFAQIDVTRDATNDISGHVQTSLMSADLYGLREISSASLTVKRIICIWNRCTGHRNFSRVLSALKASFLFPLSLNLSSHQSCSLYASNSTLTPPCITCSQLLSVMYSSDFSDLHVYILPGKTTRNSLSTV